MSNQIDEANIYLRGFRTCTFGVLVHRSTCVMSPINQVGPFLFYIGYTESRESRCVPQASRNFQFAESRHKSTFSRKSASEVSHPRDGANTMRRRCSPSMSASRYLHGCTCQRYALPTHHIYVKAWAGPGGAAALILWCDCCRGIESSPLSQSLGLHFVVL